MQSLITRGCVKKRTLKKQPAYELLPFGEHLALSLIGKTSLHYIELGSAEEWLGC
jgi:hypothetical protein